MAYIPAETPEKDQGRLAPGGHTSSRQAFP